MMRLRRRTESDPASPKRSMTRRLIGPVAVTTALALVPAGLLVLEHAPAVAAPAVHTVPSTAKTTTGAVLVSKQVALLNQGAGSLDTLSQMLKASQSDVDATTAKTTLAVASSASTAAAASRTLAELVRTAKPTNAAQVAAANAAANTLTSSLAATSSGANALAKPVKVKILLKFCTVKFVAFPGFTLVIPGIIKIVIPPIIIKIRVPCFISGDF